MKIEDFVLLSENLGQKIFISGKCSWILQKNRSALSCPPEICLFPSSAEIKALLKKGIMVISFRTEMSEKSFFEYLYIGKSYRLEDFDRKVRNRVKKGLESCLVRDADLAELTQEGLTINLQTTGRQERSEQMLTNPKLWERCIAGLYYANDVFVKGAFVDDRLIAYAVFIKVEETYYIYFPYMNRDYSSYCPMNAIYYTFVNEILALEGEIRISAGLSSYVEKKDLDRFKTNMRFEMVPCSRVLVISPIIAPLINSVGSWFLKQAEKIKLVTPDTTAQYEILLTSKHLYSLYLKDRPKYISSIEETV